MAKTFTIQHPRKGGAIATTDISAGELAIDTSNKTLNFSTNGSDVIGLDGLTQIGFACSDEGSAITGTAPGASGGAVIFYMPFDFKVTRVYASLRGALTTGGNGFQVSVYDATTAILASNLAIAAAANTAETSSFTGPASDYDFTKGDEVRFGIEDVGTSADATGLKMFLIGYKIKV